MPCRQHCSNDQSRETQPNLKLFNINKQHAYLFWSLIVMRIFKRLSHFKTHFSQCGKPIYTEGTLGRPILK